MSSRSIHGDVQWDRSIEKLPSPPPISFLEKHQKAISTVAHFAIAALLVTGISIYFKVNMSTGWFLIGTGASLLIADFVRALITHQPPPKVERGALNLLHDSKNSVEESREDHSTTSGDPLFTCSVVTWNTATWRDYSNLCGINHEVDARESLGEAVKIYLSDNKGPSYQLTGAERENRTTLFQREFENFKNFDIICLQECWEMRPEDFKAILPGGYCYFSYSEYYNRKGSCAVVWNSERFSKINHANLHYDKSCTATENNHPDTIVILEDNITKTTICVASAHLRGFSLAYEDLPEKKQDEELKRAKAGDNQARCDLGAVEKAKADLSIFAGDLNVTPEQYPDRLKIIEENGFRRDASDLSPTIYDGNLKESDGLTPAKTKLDYIFARGAGETEVQIQSIPLNTIPLENLERPSDHLPVGARVTLYKKVVR